MRPYSIDLRQRVAAAVDHDDGSLRRIAYRFRVRLSFVARLLRRRRQTGSLDPKPQGGGPPPALDHERLQRRRDRVRPQPDATLDGSRSHPESGCSVYKLDSGNPGNCRMNHSRKVRILNDSYSLLSIAEIPHQRLFV
jgi:hypothetical protein